MDSPGHSSHSLLWGSCFVKTHLRISKKWDELFPISDLLELETLEDMSVWYSCLKWSQICFRAKAIKKPWKALIRSYKWAASEPPTMVSKGRGQHILLSPGIGRSGCFANYVSSTLIQLVAVARNVGTKTLETSGCKRGEASGHGHQVLGIRYWRFFASFYGIIWLWKY